MYKLYFYRLCFIMVLVFIIKCKGKFLGIDSKLFSTTEEGDSKHRAEELEIYREQCEKVRKSFISILFRNETPEEFCEVVFRARKKTVRKRVVSYKNFTQAYHGNKLNPQDTIFPPKIEYYPYYENEGFYTVLMVDVDAPCVRRPVHRSWLHWMVVNIENDDFRKSETIVDYVGPWPEKLTGPHRYVILVYKQPHKIKFNETHILRENFIDRQNFSNLEFEEKYNLGTPYAMNYFRAKYNRFCPKLYENLHLPVPIKNVH